MTAQEVRIGNLTNFGIVYEIQQDKFYVIDENDSSVCSSWAQITPIPLTEEIIERLGFEFFDYQPIDDEDFIYKDYKIQKGKSSYYSCCDCGENGWDFCLNVSWADQIYLSKVLYVHQLQNLYFALTQTELTQPI